MPYPEMITWFSTRPDPGESPLESSFPGISASFPGKTCRAKVRAVHEAPLGADGIPILEGLA